VYELAHEFIVVKSSSAIYSGYEATVQTMTRIYKLSAALTIVAIACVMAVSTALAADTAPDYSAYKSAVTIPFANRVNFSHLTSLNINASINGGPATRFQVDTGSVGIVVSADEVPNIDPAAPKGVIKYSSSGVELYGVWTSATVRFPDAIDAEGKPCVAEAVVPVLAVTEEKVTGKGVNAAGRKASSHPHPHMFGVGFGRGAEGHPEMNPFINLKQMQAGTMRRGYAITPTGYTLGLTQDMARGYIFQKLTERPVSAQTAALKSTLKDWQTAPGWFKADGFTSSAGTILMDTGLTNMMLAAPGSPTPGDLSAGSNVTIYLLGGKLQYSFKTGDTDNPATPRKVPI
jgi:hypothetical protein